MLLKEQMEARLGVPVLQVAADSDAQRADPSLVAVQSNTWSQEMLMEKCECDSFSARVMSLQKPPSLLRAASKSCSHPPGDFHFATSLVPVRLLALPGECRIFVSTELLILLSSSRALLGSATLYSQSVATAGMFSWNFLRTPGKFPFTAFVITLYLRFNCWEWGSRVNRTSVCVGCGEGAANIQGTGRPLCKSPRAAEDFCESVVAPISVGIMEFTDPLLGSFEAQTRVGRLEGTGLGSEHSPLQTGDSAAKERGIIWHQQVRKK